MKKCSKCETEYEDVPANFYRRSDEGYKSWCKFCFSAETSQRQKTTRVVARLIPPLLLRLIDLDIECLSRNILATDMLPQLLELRADIAALSKEE